MMHTFVETMAILDKMGIDYVALGGEELCCGTAAMLWGDLDAAQAMGEELVSNIAAFSPKKAVHFCTGCHVMCWAMLPRFIPVPFESCELTQFLVENIDRIPFQQRIDKVVAVHDACSLARLGTCENPRKLLQAVPGITLVEMKHNRADSLCCGGATNTWRPDISEPLRRAPLEEAAATGAQILATTCTGCQKSFAPLEKDYGFEVQKLHQPPGRGRRCPPGGQVQEICELRDRGRSAGRCPGLHRGQRFHGRGDGASAT